MENIGSAFGVGNLLSGFIGAVAGSLLTCAWSEYKRHREYKTILRAIIEECDYNLSIIDEILDGVVKASGSFKRLSVDYFRTVREKAVIYSFPNELLSSISRVIVDMDLYNMEANYVFDGQMTSCVYAGVSGKEMVCVTRKPIQHDITQTITSARDGVVGSLLGLKRIARTLKERKEVDNG